MVILGSKGMQVQSLLCISILLLGGVQCLYSYFIVGSDQLRLIEGALCLIGCLLFFIRYMKHSRRIELSQEGLVIKWWIFSRRTEWDQVSVRRCYKYGKVACFFSDFQDCIVFSVPRKSLAVFENSKLWIPYVYCDLHMFTSVCLHVLNRTDVEKYKRDSDLLPCRDSLKDNCHFYVEKGLFDDFFGKLQYFN